MQNMFDDKYGSMPLSIEECKRSNLMVTGTNSQGKSLCAMQICDVLMNNNWQCLVFDSSGVWKQKSSIPVYYMVSETTMAYVLPKRESMIYDISLLLPSYQREFIEMVLNDVWKFRVTQKPKHWCLIVCEESHQYMRNLKGMVSQCLMRVCSVGRNQKLRVCAVSPSHVGIDTEFRRLSQQRYIFRIGNESNTKRRFSSIYSKDWYRVAKALDCGFCIYYLDEKMRAVKIPLFTSQTTPQPYREPEPEKKPTIWQKIKNAVNGSVYEDSEPMDTEIEEDALIGEDLFGEEW